jgi:hypothetical protein
MVIQEAKNEGDLAAACLNPPQKAEPIPVRGCTRLRGCMSEERDKLNKAFNRSRSRLAYLNIGLAVILVLAAVVQICIMLLDY